MKRFISKLLSPQRLFIISFASAIFIGAVILWLPCSAAGRHINVIDAFFTSPSDLSPLASRHSFVEYLFEILSAFSNIGLSMGITPSLSIGQKLAIILMMFAGGRDRCPSLFLGILRKELTYAEESVMVG